LEALSSFALARLLSDCAQGSATQREIQEELRSREEHLKYGDKTPWLFSDEELKAMRKRWQPRRKRD
jgi:hypothetical protein